MLRDFEQEIKNLETRHLRRQLRSTESPSETTVTIEGRRFIAMASNNYLGLANHPAVNRAAIEAIEQWGVGAGAARLISGTMTPPPSTGTGSRPIQASRSRPDFRRGLHD